MTTTLDSIRGEATITVAQAAEILGVGKDAAYAAIHAGTLPSLRLGSRIRVPVPALLHALGADNTGPASSNAGPATILALAKEQKSHDDHAPDSVA